jgi:peroxiredoxin Q/BCP
MSTLHAGDPAPDFTLPSSAGGDVQLSALRGRPVVLYFYPRDNTPGCTTQACEFRDLLPSFEERGAAVFGISKDSLASHGKFVSKFGLTFPLLSDADLAVHTAYGAYGEKTMYGKKVMGVIRSTVVVAADGTIASIARGVKAKGNAERTLALL